MASCKRYFVLFLDRLPDYPKNQLHDLEVDEFCLEELRRISDGQNKINRIIDFIREEMMTTGMAHLGNQGLVVLYDEKGPTAWIRSGHGKEG